VRAVTGAQLLAALENGVSKYPAMEGRFPCVAGVRFSFDPSKPAGERIAAARVEVQGEPLDLAREYRLATKEYLATGRDGYSALVGARELVSAENCPTLPVLMRTHLTLLTVASAFMQPNPAIHRALTKLMRPLHAHRTAEAETPTDGTAPAAAAAEPGPREASDPPSTTVPEPPSAAAASGGQEISAAEDLTRPSVCLMSSDDEDEETYPACAKAHCRAQEPSRKRRRSVLVDRDVRRDMLRVTAEVDGRIAVLSHDGYQQ